MNHCELCELELSAVMDGEAAPDNLAAALDHLVECSSCRDFYRSARAVDAAVAQGKASPPPERVWRRIEAEARGAVVPFPARRVASWVARAAAVGLVAVGLWAVGVLRLPSLPVGDEVEVSLESDRGSMSDERFVKLTTELLKSDRRYHRKMMEILTVVNSRMLVDEGDPTDQEPGFETTVLASADEVSSEGDGGTSRSSDRQIYW